MSTEEETSFYDEDYIRLQYCGSHTIKPIIKINVDGDIDDSDPTTEDPPTDGGNSYSPLMMFLYIGVPIIILALIILLIVVFIRQRKRTQVGTAASGAIGTTNPAFQGTQVSGAVHYNPQQQRTNLTDLT